MQVEDAGDTCEALLDTVSNGVIADDAVLERILVAALSGGHVLLEDVPGTGKTLTARCFATALGLSFSRVQFTPDLLPADVTGTYVFNEKDREFEFDAGPLFANVVLADEINRASPKTQAALLEAMEEKQVTVDGETHALPNPFFVIATQNPVDDGNGTFPLPEAQKDRFLVKTTLGYPDADGEFELLRRREGRTDRFPSVERVVSTEQVRTLRDVVETVTVDDDVKRYIVELVRNTRTDSRVSVGVSPRGCQRLFEAARTHAVLRRQAFVTPDDVQRVAEAVLTHRLVLTADARVNDVEKGDVVGDVLDDVSVPTVTRETQQRAPQGR